MAISVFDLFKVGIGPSSSHTVGPMKAAAMFAERLQQNAQVPTVARIKAEMFGSLGATGNGHGTPKAVLLGLEGEQPETVDIESIPARIDRIRNEGLLQLGGSHSVGFSEETDLILHRREELPFHPNGMAFTALDGAGAVVASQTYYSVGGGFVVDAESAGKDTLIEDPRALAFPFSSAEELLAICESQGLTIPQIMWENEKAWRDEEQTREGLLDIWRVMRECVSAGIRREGVLPGGLKVKRRAPELHQQLQQNPVGSISDPLGALDWVTLYALSVNEENAAGGRIVTAPTNGAAGIIPAVLHYFVNFSQQSSEKDVFDFLLTAAAIGILFKKNASISGAEVGCQGEVGAACSMAAGGLAQVLGGTPEQVENAAEIGMEHNLGLTCDPVGGLVQVPCIERNAMASIKAISAARMAMRGDGNHLVSLDKVIKTMRDTGKDMQDKYKETSRGGLAVNVIEVPVSVIEC
ncbi:L-serine ammonia-lyase [Biformimicrobium ophioploci]|uniref:L-serine dehydratase n=1 Tax=Biformimicrobium ophioploci TaxID=3036711 RepID=A0ABQ6LZ95_9GAMM|nr:L-serine ammonia-lyase [Microbulbifer sp. NKW57]GMG87415.1 L-serine ammonia-lyase [Microbulbifer sp. NKW57]